MLQDVQFNHILYFLVLFKFIFIIVYSVYVYGLLFHEKVVDNIHTVVIICECIFMTLMSFVLLYRFSKDTIQVSMEERFLIWTVTFVIVWEELLKLYSLEWSTMFIG